MGLLTRGQHAAARRYLDRLATILEVLDRQLDSDRARATLPAGLRDDCVDRVARLLEDTLALRLAPPR